MKYHNITLSEKGAVTLEMPNLAVQYNASGVGCAYGTTSNGIYTTGNQILKGEREGQITSLEWDA